jgi:hypothetical protein
MPEVYGEAWIETARDELVTLLNALRTTMATGYDPTFSYVHARHTVAKLLLNAVTIDLGSHEEGDISWATDVANRYMMTFTVRVHTAYADEASDGQKQARLINSIINKLKDNYGLVGDAYHIEEITDISVNETFAESDTVGGSLSVVVSVNVEHTQE